ncbi:MAG: glycerate kinase [Candidatus Nanopelagicales bacterium]|nr:glycerate kinase [Candidatus Nanopelagicales bacterium]MDZ4248999.1 glycerate kinase [Candidatus Nanopelagicales bacterium]
MRVLIAVDKFAGTLSAGEAAAAVEAGWSHARPGDAIDTAPMSDGGPGFVEVMHVALGGDIREVVVSGPMRGPVAGQVLIVHSATGPEAYIESAQACGLALVARDLRDPGLTTTCGVGELIREAVSLGARWIVIGLGGSATTDGGAGMLAALGARATGPDGSDATALLSAGGLTLRNVGTVDLARPREVLRGVELVAATDVDSPLLGPQGASFGFAAQKGASEDEARELEAAMAAWADAAGAGAAGVGAGAGAGAADGADLTDVPGAGAAGGLGFGLLQIGAQIVPGSAAVIDAIGLADRCQEADLVITGEGRFDWQSLHGKLVSGVASTAAGAGRPTVVLAGQVTVSPDECSKSGITAAYSVVEHSGSITAALADPAGTLADLADTVARQSSIEDLR